MQQAGSASGYEQFLQMMQQMAGQQQSLNQQGMQLSLGQMAAAAQQQMLPVSYTHLTLPPTPYV